MIEDNELYPPQNEGKHLYEKPNGTLTEKEWFDTECAICGRGMEVPWENIIPGLPIICDDCAISAQEEYRNWHF